MRIIIGRCSCFKQAQAIFRFSNFDVQFSQVWFLDACLRQRVFWCVAKA